MTITNPIIGGVLDFIFRNHKNKLAFTYEETLIDSEVLDASRVRQYIQHLQMKVDDEIATLTKEYGL